jgi:hypothetical protein
VTKTYRLNVKCHLNSIKEGLIILLYIPAGLFIGHLSGKISWVDYPGILVIFLLVNLVLFLPAFFLHFTYFYYNSGTELTIDYNSKSISITDDRITSKFNFDDIHIVEQNLGVYYKDKIDNLGRWTLPWTGYGYLKLKLKNGQVFILTSLILDIQKPPISISQTNYRFLPFIIRKEMTFADRRMLVENDRQVKVNDYMKKFANLPHENLREKLRNSKKYEPEAVIASKTLLGLDTNENTNDGEVNGR